MRFRRLSRALDTDVDEERHLHDSGDSGYLGTTSSLDRVPERPEEPGPRSTIEDKVGPLEDSTDLKRMATATLEEVIEAEKKLINLSDEMDYVALNIGIALEHIQDLLPRSSRIFYVGFAGPKGSGKSTATSFCARVCRKGVKLEAVTYPAVAHACMEGMTLCLDEFDAQAEKCPDLDTIVRQGITLDATYMKMVKKDEGKWVPDMVPCGGMKFLNWRNPIDDALQQRTLVIKMAPGATTRMIVNNEAPDRFTAPIQVWFSAQAASVRQRWTPDKVRLLIEDRGGQLTERLDTFSVKVPRQRQKAFWMLVVSILYDWDLEGTIRVLVEKQPEDEVFDDYKELALEMYWQRAELMESRGNAGEVVLSLQDFKKDMTERIKDKGLYLLRSKGALSWTGFRQECGFVEGVNEKKDRRSGKRVLTFDDRVQKALGVDKVRQARASDWEEDKGSQGVSE